MGLFSKIFGSKVKVPEFSPVNIDTEHGAAIDANLKALPKATELARRESKSSQDILLDSLRAAMPHYDAMVSGGERVIGDLLSGKVPGDVASQIADRAAARGISTGTGALSRFTKNLELRDLGLTSLDMTQRGLESAMNWFKTQRATAVAEPIRPSSMFISPQQRIAHKTSERNLQFQRDLAEEKQRAAHSPVASGIFNTAMWGVGMAGGFGPAIAGIGGLVGRGNAPTGGFLGPAPGGGAVTHRYANDAYASRYFMGGFGPQSTRPATDFSGINNMAQYGAANYTRGANFGGKPFGQR